MRITLYFINWNDSYYIPHIAKHYGKFCQKMVMFDNYSTDQSRIIATKLGMDVSLFGEYNQLNDQYYLDIKNNCWKEEKGKSDYVIVCDADEFLLLDNLKGTAPIVKGYNMISETLPQEDILEITTGEEEVLYSKQAIFNPNEIDEINYGPGCHGNNIQGNVSREGSCQLLHYRLIGGVQRIIDRHQEYNNRLSTFNIENKFGYQYQHTAQQKEEEWKEIKQKATTLW